MLFEAINPLVSLDYYNMQDTGQAMSTTMRFPQATIHCISSSLPHPCLPFLFLFCCFLFLSLSLSLPLFFFLVTVFSLSTVIPLSFYLSPFPPHPVSPCLSVRPSVSLSLSLSFSLCDPLYASISLYLFPVLPPSIQFTISLPVSWSPPFCSTLMLRQRPRPGLRSQLHRQRSRGHAAADSRAAWEGLPSCSFPSLSPSQRERERERERERKRAAWEGLWCMLSCSFSLVSDSLGSLSGLLLLQMHVHSHA